MLKERKKNKFKKLAFNFKIVFFLFKSSEIKTMNSRQGLGWVLKQGKRKKKIILFLLRGRKFLH